MKNTFWTCLIIWLGGAALGQLTGNEVVREICVNVFGLITIGLGIVLAVRWQLNKRPTPEMPTQEATSTPKPSPSTDGPATAETDLSVTWTKWLVRSSELRRRYSFEDKSDGSKLSLEIVCSLEMGSLGMPHRFYHLYIAPQITSQEGYIIGLVETEDSQATTGFITLRVAPTDGATVVGLLEREDSDKLHEVLKAGKDVTVVLMANPNQKILSLPLPNDSEYAKCYESCLQAL